MSNQEPYHSLGVEPSSAAIYTIRNLVLVLEQNKAFYAGAFILDELNGNKEILENTEQAIGLLGTLCAEVKKNKTLESARSDPEFTRAEQFLRNYPIEVAGIISKNAHLSQR